MNWREELAKLEFGFTHIENFPDIACEALRGGLDTPNLRILAGLGKKDTSEIRCYINRTLGDLRITEPMREESAWIMIRYFIGQIVSGQIDPHEGVHTIVWDIYHKTNWNIQDRCWAGDSIGIQELLGLCDTFDDLSVATHRWDLEKTNDELLVQLKADMRKAASQYRDLYFPQQTNPPDG